MPAASMCAMRLSGVSSCARRWPARSAMDGFTLWAGARWPKTEGDDPMFSGAHLIIYSKDAEADRAFFRDVLDVPHVGVGHGWLIFALPPSELAMHPTDGEGG